MLHRAFHRRLAAALLLTIASGGIVSPLGAQSELARARLRVPASQIENPRAAPLSFDLRRGIDPDEAALIATYQNLALRVGRARRGLAQAQIVQAGVLPNPQVTYERDYVTGGNTLGTRSDRHQE